MSTHSIPSVHTAYHYQYNNEIARSYPKYNNVCSYVNFLLGSQERVQINSGKQAISV